MTLEMILCKQVIDLNKEKHELLQALKDVIEDFELRSVGQDTDDSRYRKAKDVIAKFERVL